MYFFHSKIKDLKQFLIIRGNQRIFQLDFEENTGSNLDKNDLMTGFISALESFSTSYAEDESDSNIVRFGNSNIIIARAKSGIVGALIVAKISNQKIEKLENFPSLLVKLFDNRYQGLLESGKDFDEAIFSDFMPYVVGTLVENKISPKNIPKQKSVSKFPESVTNECKKIFEKIDGKQNIAKISESLNTNEDYLPLFNFLKLLDLIKT
ncbi:MAG: hypothetical protein HeimC3_08100 [Candidatus Heimdallarchaeota archaeon LC_3]|nr:MAG: hypothetical protein HeimC3_08100 [Candidatus Heimdallarchaeota archaeon LC_3]